MNVGNDTAQGTRGSDAARVIPAGRETTATVVQVSQSQSQSGQFIVQLQVGSRMIELATPRPFPQGSQVLLSRDAQGNIQLQLPVNNNTTADANRLQNAPAQARAEAEALLMRITANSSQQATSLPVNLTQRGIVLAQPSATTAQANASSTNSPTSNSPTSSTATTSGNQAASAGGQATTGQTINTATLPSSTSAAQSALGTNPGNTTTNAILTANPSPSTTPSNLTAQSAANTTSTNPAVSNMSSASAGQNTASSSNANLSNTSAANTALANPTSATNPQSMSNAGNPVNASLLTQSASAQLVNQIPSPTPVTNAATANTAAAGSNQTPVQVNSGQANSPATSLASSNLVPSPPGNTASNSAATSTNTNANLTTPLANLIGSNEGSNRPQGFPVRVLVAGQVIDLVSPRPVQSGQQVDVTRNEQGLIRIQFSQPATPLAQQPAIQAIMQQTLREVLPVQLPLADGLNQLMQISERQGVRQNNALNQLIQSMLSLFSVKPGDADADKAIARNLQQGGLLSEAGLSKTGQQQPPPDLKQQLGQLLKVADQLPAQAREQLNQLVNALLARSTAQQISSLQRWRDLPDGGQERHYRLDLPIQQQQGFDNAELRITEHRRRNEEGEFVTLWSVKLHFELEQDGAVDAELSLQDRFQLNANFWVEKPETLARMRERLSHFEQELKSKGFDVAPLNARLGKLANPEVTPLSKRLVDIHT